MMAGKKEWIMWDLQTESKKVPMRLGSKASMPAGGRFGHQSGTFGRDMGDSLNFPTRK